MMPYKFISIDKFLQDVNSSDKDFDIIRKAYQDLIIRIIDNELYIIYPNETICRIDPTDYIVLQENGRLTTLEESEIES